MALQQDLVLHPNARLVQIYVDRMLLSYATKQITEHANFSHLRSLIDNFAVAENVLHKLMKQTTAGMLQPAPYLFIQAMERTEAGLTFVELRALRELGFNSGASFVAIYNEQGKLLEPDQLPKPYNPTHFKLLVSMTIGVILLILVLGLIHFLSS
ncbi:MULTISPECIES: hypothetical protein [unclassified Acinetobacter]|uniref:Uncharacterized protein n=1 Tax=Acinetobacter corruptisaponis TaxID=3045147 RepID=A0ABY8S422_9GAMM|nr:MULTISPECIES: hypothetical protein [unclassified Acinetobacter]MDH0030861.1 hypothetical protein [Acinetobacter sp. GD04021]MDH0886366.1 hypothetical protein [Acinetobacter sp. GD03873]MDH1082884.1 hypothetical protein [Acinetobacter sp. GD03983]MDH2189910.1 hypothetical protein [Acinetobacter sp. GD03645]MDH2203063.1 hypothetical protein [Acinetobacter sp. GD03647]